MPEQAAQITISQTNPKLEALIETLIVRQEQTNALLEKLAEASNQSAVVPHREAAKMLNIHTDTMDKLVRRGEISCKRIGGKKCYLRSDLSLYLSRKDSSR